MTSSVDLWGAPEPGRPFHRIADHIEQSTKDLAESTERFEKLATAFVEQASRVGPIGHRMSLLPIAQYCGTAGELSERYGAGRAAAMSSAFHAHAAGLPIAQTLLGRLTSLEREEVLSWKVPATVVAGGGVELAYSEAMKEFEVALSSEGITYSLGHPDMAWIVDAPGELGVDRMQVAFVGDIKKSVWTTEDGPDSLQLHAYGWGTAQLYGCDAYCTGIWSATDGEWLWSKDWVILDSDKGREILARLIAAATHRGTAYTGLHCRGCYARMHCPEHLLPAALSQSFLAPITEGGDLSTVDHTLVLKIQALEELCEKAKKQIQAGITQGVIEVKDPESGKVYSPVNMPGRVSVDAKKLSKELGEGASPFISQGAPYQQFRWLKRAK